MNLVDQHPLVVAVDAKIADQARRRAEFKANVSTLAAVDEEAQRQYSEALDQAMRIGAPAPDPPILRLQGADVDVRHGFMEESQQLTEARRRAVAAAYPDILKEARAQAIKAVRAAKPTVEKLLASMTEVAELLAAIRASRDAGNDDSVERKSFRDGKLTVETFLRLTVTGGDPTDLLDLVGNRRGVENRDAGMVLGDIQQLINGTHVRPQPVDASRSSVA